MYRYLVDFDSNELEVNFSDVIIIGGGIAGMFAALGISDKYKVTILTKEKIDISNSVLAQGGIAVSIHSEDSPEMHYNDTLYAGAGLCNEESVWKLVSKAKENIDKLLEYGIHFDSKGMNELSLGREAAHSRNRIIHIGDATGKVICDRLIATARKRQNIVILEQHFAVDIISEDGICKGVLAYDETSDRLKVFISGAVVCATGGIGQMYTNTSNPEVATGDGFSIAYRAGAELMDLEFVQFHPTVLYHPSNKSFLISEAVRGDGAILLNKKGERFMHNYHELGELAPRDVVARAIYEEMKKHGDEFVYLDITFKDRDYLSKRFPNIFNKCLEYGIDISKDLIPVSPAEHYMMGGIKSDLTGSTSLERFFAAGEVACTGVHGANRLASNSLLEGLVAGGETANQINMILSKSNINSIHIESNSINLSYKTDRKDSVLDFSSIKNNMKKLMSEYAGIVRNEDGLKKALNEIKSYYNMISEIKCRTVERMELHNMLILAKLIIESALERTESRGAHYREDYIKTDDRRWKRNIMKKINVSE